MFKKITILFTAALFILVSNAILFASEGPKGNDRKGKYTYRKVYKSCSESGQVESATPKISPSDKTMAEWKSIFDTKNFDEFGCKDHWVSLSDEDFLDIYSYFYGHASDSPSPATCK
ncbi:MAG: cytochrome c family protein [Desulfobacterales bacterium RIFOXYA12_FULL_46_15]|nr:MAG: cytochrome c family protein [Desulfobacterales bacterium RIFOXYA12_FULL_46_15]